MAKDYPLARENKQAWPSVINSFLWRIYAMYKEPSMNTLAVLVIMAVLCYLLIKF
jgi:hypothetical protein